LVIIYKSCIIGPLNLHLLKPLVLLFSNVFVSFGILSVLQVIEENNDFYVELQRREKLKYIEDSRIWQSVDFLVRQCYVSKQKKWKAAVCALFYDKPRHMLALYTCVAP
jgi:hypothetical protein